MFCVCVCVHLVAQSCLTFCDPLDCSLPGSSVHGIFSGKKLEWVAIFSSRGSSCPRDWSCISRDSSIAGRFFTLWAMGFVKLRLSFRTDYSHFLFAKHVVYLQIGYSENTISYFSRIRLGGDFKKYLLQNLLLLLRLSNLNNIQQQKAWRIILDGPKSSFGFFLMILWKNLN